MATPTPSRCFSTGFNIVALYRAWPRFGGAVVGAVLLANPGTVIAADGPPPRRPMQEVVEALLKEQEVAVDRAALLLYSTRERRYLASVRQDAPLIAASNTKLVTTYVALRELGPNYRWRTRLSLVEQNDGAGATPRQGLLVEGSGDPTLTGRGLDAMALRLKAEGVRRIDGPIYLDASLFEADLPQPGLPPESPAYVPLSPFIVDGNTVEFTISRSRAGPPDVLSVLPADSVRILSRLEEAAEGRSVIRVEQGWNEKGTTFTLSGAVRRDPRVHTVTTAVSQPAQWYYQWLRLALRRMGIEGEPPLRMGVPESGTTRLLFTWLSPPLREAIVEIEKQSNNLGAEVLLRTLAQATRPKGVTGNDGLKVVRRALEKEFPGMGEHYHLADGSGLSRANRLSPLILVKLLNRAQQDPALRTEFLSSLPVVGWDGTLRYRGAAVDLEGKVRGKSGTLMGVCNLSGYLTTADDTVVFAFLINDGGRSVEANQAAQDAVLAGILDALIEPTAPAVAEVAAAKPSPVAPTSPPPAPAPAKVEPKSAPSPTPAKVDPKPAAAAKVEPAPEPEIQPPPPSPKPARKKK